MNLRTDPKAHLGSGWAFPVRPQGGALRMASHEALVEQAIGLILLTEPLERERLPEFGAGLRRFVFEPNAPATHRELERRIRRGLTEWEPRITLENVTVSADVDGNRPNVVLIDVDYVVRATNTAHNLVFPFFLSEGGG
jgi:phage baseplate assembly protein W